MASVERRRELDLLKWLVWLGYCGLAVLLLTRHENWRDEAQAWLLARDLDLPGLARQMAYEGHPCLWHLLLMPLARLGLPYVSMNVLSIALCAAAAAILLWRSPLPLPMQAALLLGAPMLYYLPIVSRSYSLIPPILMLNAWCYPTRRERPLRYGLTIALLVQTHIMMLGMAGALSLFWLGETLAAWRKDRDARALPRQAGGLLLPLLSLIALLAQLFGVAASSAFPEANGWFGRLVARRFVVAMYRTFRAGHTWLTLVFLACFAVAALAVFLAALKQSEALKPLLIAGLGWAFMLLLLAVSGRNSSQKLAAVAPMLAWLAWRLWPALAERQARLRIVAMLAALCVPMLLQHWSSSLDDWRNPCSDSAACAAFLEANVPEDVPVVVVGDAHASSLLPHMTRRQLVSAATGEAFSFVTWKNVDWAVAHPEDMKAWMRRHFPDAREAELVITPGSREINRAFLDRYRVLALFGMPEYLSEDLDYIDNERYVAFRVNLTDA